MDCARSIEILSDYHAGELGDTERSSVSIHLGKCPPCAGVYQELTVIVETAVILRRQDTITFPDEERLWHKINLAKQ